MLKTFVRHKYYKSLFLAINSIPLPEKSIGLKTDKLKYNKADDYGTLALVYSEHITTKCKFRYKIVKKNFIL